MLRPASADDLPAILTIRDNAGAERLSNPLALTEALAGRLIEAGAVWVWQAPGEPLTGFVAINAETGAIAAQLVAAGFEGRGIGRALLAAAGDALRAAGCVTATIALDPGAAAERHYRAAGWRPSGSMANGNVIFAKPL